jgi:hypothetical protein
MVELIIGLTVLILTATPAFMAFTQINRAATAAHLLTSAQYIVQSQINLIQVDGPFNPSLGQIPPELTTGTTTGTGISIYDDPSTVAGSLVTGSMTTIVTNISTSTEYAYQASVQLSYNYRGTNYQVMQCTVRGSDQ